MKKKRGLSLNSSCALSCDYNTKETHLSKLHAAASTGNVFVIRILLMIHKDINKLDGKFRTPLHLACANGHTTAVLLLVQRNCIINVCDSEQQTPLIKALQCRHIMCASILLSHDANPNIADKKGNTALHYAVVIPSIEAVSHLREEGARLDATNLDGYTPLMLAVATNSKDIVQYLLDEGANVNAVERKGRTSLMIASSKGHISLVKMLLQQDVDIYMSDNKGRTAEDHAFKNGHNACLDLIFEYRSQKCVKISPAPYVSSKMIGPGRCVECSFTLGDHASDKEDLKPTSKQTPRARISRKALTSERILEEDDIDLPWDSECSEQPPKEKDQAQINAELRAEMCALKQDLGQVQASSQERESRHIKEIELLREKVEELSREVKMREETLTQTVIRHNEQISALKTEATILSSKNTLRQVREELADAVKKLAISEASLERMTQSRDCLEMEKQYFLRKLKPFNSKVSPHDQDSNNLWEEQPKSRFWLETRLAELERENVHLKEQVEREKQAANRLDQLYKETATLFEQENFRVRMLLEMAKKKHQYYETGKGHQNSFQDKAENQNLDTKSDEIFQMLQELDKSVPQKPSQGIADVDIGSTRVSTVGTPARSMRNLTIDQDPVYRATQEYLEVLKKNYKN